MKSLIAQKTPKAPVFRMPGNKHLAGMLKADLAAARAEWMKAAINDPDEYARREQSDFLDVANHEGEVIDFHALRHTCGAWLAMAGVYPKIVQTVLRHSSITLTMDTYGHLFPGQEDEAVTKLQDVMGTAFATLAATGTDDERLPAQAQTQCAGREAAPEGATACESDTSEASDPADADARPNLLSLKTSGEVMLPDARQCGERRARESNPQPVNRHLISNQTPHHSDTLRET